MFHSDAFTAASLASFACACGWLSGMSMIDCTLAISYLADVVTIVRSQYL